MPRVGASAHSVAPATTEVVGKAAAEASDLRQPPLTSDQKTAQKMRDLKSKFMMPTTYDITGMLAGGALGWVAEKLNLPRMRATVAMVARAPIQALRETTLGTILHLPSNLFKAAGEEATHVDGGAGGKVAGWAKSANAHSAELKTNAEDAERVIAGYAKPYGKVIGERLDSFGKGPGLGSAIREKLHGFINWRHTAASDRHGAAVDEAQKALKTEGMGLRQSVVNSITRNKPGSVDIGELQSVWDGLEKAKDYTGKAKTDHLHKVIFDLKGKVSASALTGEVLTDEAKARAGNVMKHLEKALSSSKALATYEVAAKNTATLKTLVAVMAKSVGRLPIFNAFMAVALFCGVGAVAVAAHGESKQATEAFKKVSHVLADEPNSRFLKGIKAAQKSADHWSIPTTGVRMVGEVAEVAMWMSPGGGGKGMMAGLFLPGLYETLAPGNTVLGALEALDRSDKHQIVLQPSDRIHAMAEVIAVMPTVTNHNAYNHLARGMAAEMQARNYTYKDVVRTLGHDAEFRKLASEISAKQEAEAAKVAAETKAAEPAAVAAPAPMVSAAPTNHISVGATKEYAGVVASDNRQHAIA